MPARDGERLTDAARSRAELAEVRRPASDRHRLDAIGRLERADQHGCAGLRAAHEVEAEVHSIAAVNIGVPWRPEHCRVGCGRPAEGMRRRIGRVIRLRLDDEAADALDEEPHADQVARRLRHASPEETRVEPSKVDRRRVISLQIARRRPDRLDCGSMLPKLPHEDDRTATRADDLAWRDRAPPSGPTASARLRRRAARLRCREVRRGRSPRRRRAEDSEQRLRWRRRSHGRRRQ